MQVLQYWQRNQNQRAMKKLPRLPWNEPPPRDCGGFWFAVFLIALTGLMFLVMIIDEINDRFGTPWL